MNRISASIAEMEATLAAHRDGRYPSSTAMRGILQRALDALWDKQMSEMDRDCSCERMPCKYPLCHANRERPK